MEKWQLMGRMYPDFHTAHYNAALAAQAILNRHEECASTASLADQPQYTHRGDAVYLRATCLAGDNRLTESLTEFARAASLGVQGSGLYHALALAAADQRTEATTRLLAVDTIRVPNSDWAVASAQVAFALDDGDFATALERL